MVSGTFCPECHICLKTCTGPTTEQHKPDCTWGHVRSCA